VGKRQRVVLVLDRAGWPPSKELVVPEGMHLLFLPPYVPELQPCERLWPLWNEGVANRQFQTLDDLQTAQVQRCALLQNQPDAIRSLTHFRLQAPCSCKTAGVDMTSTTWHLLLPVHQHLHHHGSKVK
jgi:DDE superfamily endonuclease